MDKELEALYDLCEVISRELDECNEKIRQAGGKLSSSDVDYLDKLTHALKSIKTTIAMMEADDEGGSSYRGGNSRRYMPWYGGMSYEDGTGNSYDGGMSYARGRGRNAARDSMGRYSSRGYSRDANEDFRAEVEALMQKAPDEHARSKLQSMLQSM